jgi:hypothetical protein
MTRRSPEVVDGALGFQHHGSPRDASYVWEALDILADEVRALREELAKAGVVDGQPCTCGSGAHPRVCKKHPSGLKEHCDSLDLEGYREEFPKLEATLERVEALAISWGYDPYAKALKAALKGDP